MTNARELIHYDPRLADEPHPFRVHRYQETVRAYEAYFGAAARVYWPLELPRATASHTNEDATPDDERHGDSYSFGEDELAQVAFLTEKLAQLHRMGIIQLPEPSDVGEFGAATGAFYNENERDANNDTDECYSAQDNDDDDDAAEAHGFVMVDMLDADDYSDGDGDDRGDFEDNAVAGKLEEYELEELGTDQDRAWKSNEEIELEVLKVASAMNGDADVNGAATRTLAEDTDDSIKNGGYSVTVFASIHS